MDKYEECRREMMCELGEAACDEALRLGWPVDGGSGDPVDWMVSEIERLREAEDAMEVRLAKARAFKQLFPKPRTDFERDMI